MCGRESFVFSEQHNSGAWGGGPCTLRARESCRNLQKSVMWDSPEEADVSVPLPSSSTLLLLLAPVFPPIHPPAFYSSKGVEEFAAKINEFIFTHHPSSSAAWGRAVQLMTVEEGGRGGCRHSQRAARHVLPGRSGGNGASVVPPLRGHPWAVWGLGAACAVGGGWMDWKNTLFGVQKLGTILRFRAERQCHLVCFQGLGAIS